jgi:archaellin
LKKAEVGIGTLIVFISLILVGAIAASVLIQSATSLQNKALKIGSESKDSLSDGFQTLLLYGTDGSDGGVDELRLKVKLLPGSGPVSYNNTMLHIGTGSNARELKYASGACTDSNTNSSHYFVESLITVSGHSNSSLRYGEVSMLCFEAPETLSSDEEFTMKLIPLKGQTTELSLIMPQDVRTTRVFLYP